MATVEASINMQFLAGLNGGVVANAKTARELANILVEQIAEKNRISFIGISDSGDFWHVDSKETTVSGNKRFNFDIRKADAAVLRRPNWVAIATVNVAKSFAKILLSSIDPDGAPMTKCR
jgi:hypothetical protein